MALLALGAPASPAASQEAYFPPELTEARECRFAGLTVNEPVLSDFQVEWFSAQLAAAREPPLMLRPYGADTALRFTWLRSFDEPIVIRIEGPGGGKPWMKAIRLSGAGGYEPGEIDEQIERYLTQDEARRLAELLHDIDLSRVASAECGDLGLDGAEWLVETMNDDGYRFYRRWSPDDGEIRKLGLFLLRLTGWNNKPIY